MGGYRGRGEGQPVCFDQRTQETSEGNVSIIQELVIDDHDVNINTALRLFWCGAVWRSAGKKLENITKNQPVARTTPLQAHAYHNITSEAITETF
ncbi:hypothetical protein JYU34_014375 [Plutella xylostella]|uniref:Uncharacterized protein n=1 Tax=Plutella xylostella TaxID=51655 RepID=A0ABQ7Q972_PLUXY|nr:hypothetical protein JYU34_014375 [Plutella xylostella]